MALKGPHREAHGGTVNDVVLATITGGLRTWLMTRSESMSGLRKINAMVPVSVIDRELEATSLGSQIAPHFVIGPGVAIFITVLAFNLFGDGVRDALDPKGSR